MLRMVRDLQRYTEDDVKRVVNTNDKQRFLIVVDKSTGRLKVRANQGHSVEVSKLLTVHVLWSCQTVSINVIGVKSSNVTK